MISIIKLSNAFQTTNPMIVNCQGNEMLGRDLNLPPSRQRADADSRGLCKGLVYFLIYHIILISINYLLLLCDQLLEKLSYTVRISFKYKCPSLCFLYNLASSRV